MEGGSSGSDDLIPIPGQSLIISYECHLQNGTLVDSSVDHQDANNKFHGIQILYIIMSHRMKVLSSHSTPHPLSETLSVLFCCALK
jgi:hypothetical protein